MRKLIAYLNGHHVGTLSEGNDLWSFEYNPQWASAPASFDLSPAVRYKPLLRAYESMRRMEYDQYCPSPVKDCIACAHTTFQNLTAAAAANDPSARVEGFRRFQCALCGCATTAMAATVPTGC